MLHQLRKDLQDFLFQFAHGITDRKPRSPSASGRRDSVDVNGTAIDGFRLEQNRNGQMNVGDI